MIICCVIGMIWSGGFFAGEGFVTAFSNSDASVGLAVGSFFAFVITIVFYLIRRVLRFHECMSCIYNRTRGTEFQGQPFPEFMQKLIAAGGLVNFLPAIIFLVGCFLAFATGTSWGTFGILIPIVVAVFAGTNETMMIISISACMAGAVCGDHCSPISDTTIMASAGAQCNHVNHVSTQLPYALTVAAVSFVTYLVAGFVQTAFVALPVGIVLMIVTLIILRKSGEGKEASSEK